MPTAADLLEVHNLLGRYAQSWDNFDLDGFAALFTESAEADFGGTVLLGAKAIKAFHENRVGSFRAAGIQRRHLLGSIVVTATEPMRAAVALYGQVFSTDARSGVTTIMPPVQYRGETIRDSDGAWKIAKWSARPDRPFPA